jgi:hypothetical protein
VVRIFTFALALASVGAASPVRAETIVIRPDPCPARGEQPLIIDLGEVELFNAAPAEALGNVFIIYPPAGDGWASARLLMRFDLDRPVEPPVAPDCGSTRIFRVPR